MNEQWYKYNVHDPGTCGLVFPKKEMGCPNHNCENHGEGYTDCVKCKILDEKCERQYRINKVEDFTVGVHTDCVKKKKTKQLWITIKPKDFSEKSVGGHTERSFIEKVLKRSMNTDFIKSGWYAFEWGNENCTMMNKGIHIHMLICEGDHRRIKAWIKRAWKDEYAGGFVKWPGKGGKVVRKNVCIDFKMVKASWGQDKLDYVGGYTDSESKDWNKLNDIKKRAEFKLDEVYTKNFIIFK